MEIINYIITKMVIRKKKKRKRKERISFPRNIWKLLYQHFFKFYEYVDDELDHHGTMRVGIRQNPF